MGAWTTRSLLAAKAEGAVIRVNIPDDDHYNKQAVHDPERPRDLTPWRLARGEARFRASDCRPTGLHGGPWALVRALRIPIR